VRTIFLILIARELPNGHRTLAEFLLLWRIAMSFALYGVGTLILIIGVLYICHLVHLPTHWTIALAILLVGGGLMGAVNSTRQRDKSE
jgi:uncharacterized membrane protein YqjE